MYRERHKSAPLKTSTQDLRQWGEILVVILRMLTEERKDVRYMNP